MLTPSSETVIFGEPFTTTIVVSISDTAIDPNTGEPVTTDTPSTEIPTVTADFVDPGVTIETAPGLVTLSGAYQTIIPITWHWLDLGYQQQSGVAPPSAGTYSKIIRVDSPPLLKKDCTYTIGSDTFVHTVDLVSYDRVANLLKTLVAGTPP
jgi:hypothetical protein